jgi:hypothetical protein
MNTLPYYPAQLVPLNVILLNPHSTLTNFIENDEIIIVSQSFNSIEITTKSGNEYLFDFDQVVYCRSDIY